MNSFLIYILKSTFCISLFYLAFRTLMRKEAFFRLNRLLLLATVLFSVLIPAIKLPQFVKPAVEQVWLPAFPETSVFPVASAAPEVAEQAVATPDKPAQPAVNRDFQWIKMAQYGYLAGIAVSLLVLIYSIASVLLIFRRARMVQMDGFRLLIVDGDIAPFSFGRFVVISQADYDIHQHTILTHEEAHIRLNHFVDLVLLETTKLFHWFNPVMYWLIRDLKEIHEYQADQYTLQKGVDATQYQFLIIQKSVGPQRFALANSFNHCQIKKRIIMMTKQKTSKAALWKVATFLPLLALLLMAFSKPGGNGPLKENLQALSSIQNDVSQQNQQSKFVIEIKKDGNYIDNKLCTLEELKQKAELWQKNNAEGLVNISTAKDISISRVTEVIDLLKNINIKPVLSSPSANNKTDKHIDHSIEIESVVVTAISKESSPPPPPTSPSDRPRPSLYVVDGMILEENPMKDMSDIQSFSVINSKTATEMFGEKGKNGAVIITTKIIGATERNSRYIPNQTIAPQKNKDGVFVTSEEMPRFPGGTSALLRLIAEKVKYPIEAQKDNVQGNVYVSFVVNSNGKVEKAKIARGIREDLDAEAIRVVSLLPDWIPGKNKGEAVDVALAIPIQFALQSNEGAPVKAKNDVFLVVDEMPQFPGGEKELMKFIANNIKYPEQAKTDKAQGEVMVNFVVRSNGKIGDPKIIKKVHPALDAEAIRIVNTFPDWIPGKQDGKTVDVSCTVPIKFNL